MSEPTTSLPIGRQAPLPGHFALPAAPERVRLVAEEAAAVINRDYNNSRATATMKVTTASTRAGMEKPAYKLTALLLELVYTTDDMQPLADAPRSSHSPFAVPHSPFKWNEERRALLRAELDAWFARAYGLARES